MHESIFRKVMMVILYIFIITMIVCFIFSVSVFIYCELFDNTIHKVTATDQFNNLENQKTDPIDIVYTWVNSKDPDWKKMKQKELENVSSLIKIDNSKLRWVNTNEPHEEISLSIESVRTYLPWVRNIFVITQRPQQLPENIVLKWNVIHIHHDQIFKDSQLLPVFSSNAIETNLHRIPGLSEKFIYLNDDMYINRPMKRSDFFYKDFPIFRYYKYLSFYINHISKLINSDDTFMTSNVYCRHLLENKGLNYHYACIHHATPITKQIMIDAEQVFQQVWDKTASNKFRTNKDVPPVYISLALAFHNHKVVILKNDNIKHTLLAIYIHAPLFHNNSHLMCVNHIKANSMKLLKKQILSPK